MLGPHRGSAPPLTGNPGSAPASSLEIGDQEHQIQTQIPIENSDVTQT